MKKIQTEIKDDSVPLRESSYIRPLNLDEYIGQSHIKQNLRVSMKAAKSRDSALDHFLLSGPPGLGKTSLASVIANEMQSKLKTINAPVIEKIGDLASILAGLENGDILFMLNQKKISLWYQFQLHF